MPDKDGGQFNTEFIANGQRREKKPNKLRLTQCKHTPSGNRRSLRNQTQSMQICANASVTQQSKSCDIKILLPTLTRSPSAKRFHSSESSRIDQFRKIKPP